LKERAMSNTPSPSFPLDERTLITRSTELIIAPVHDETVMMDIQSGHYYGLDDIGSEIWRRLEAPRTFGDLVDSLVADYDADRSVIAEDVRTLLSVMVEHNVVTLA
jgi:Coenzyme PQQ synthesis protein D (PqqD)